MDSGPRDGNCAGVATLQRAHAAVLALTLFRLRTLRVFLHHWRSFLEQIHFCKGEQGA